MKKLNKRRPKLKGRLAAFAALIILGISVISVIFLSGLATNNDSQNPPSTPSNPDTSNPTQSPSNPSETPPTAVVTPNPETPQYQIKILNKQIPSGYVMGLPPDGGLINGMNVVFLSNPSQQVSIRFTSKLGGTVSKLVIDAFAFEGQPTVQIGLQADNGGSPNGQWIGENAFGTVLLSSSSGFKTVQLTEAVSLAKGRIYHVVVKEPANSLSGTAALSTYQANGFAQPLNPEDPDLVWNDASMNILFSEGNGWQEQNKWPIFVVGYSDGSLEGQPYSLSAQWVVFGSTYVGQTIVPASDYRLGKIAFDVSLGSGVAKDKLYYQVRDSGNSILAEGVFVEPAQLSASQAWHEVTLATPVALKAGQLYRIIVLSPNSDLANAIYFYGHEFSFDPTIGYGALQHQLTSSINGGVTWGENPDADAIFKLTTA